MNLAEQFNQYRSRMNEIILSFDNLLIKRVFNLDSVVYQNGCLDIKTKELIGLSCSLVLRCDDCVKHHLGRCFELELSKDSVYEALSLSTLIGGTIVIPHLRKTVEFWDELEKNASKGS